MQKFAEDDRIEQMKQTQRRMKQLEHRRAVDALIAERHKMSHEKELEQKKLDVLELELSKYREDVIEQERQRLLREHAAKLAGFLPKVFLIDYREYFVISPTWTCLMKNLKRSSIFVNKVYRIPPPCAEPHDTFALHTKLIKNLIGIQISVGIHPC
jgi:hypothetical protein